MRMRIMIAALVSLPLGAAEQTVPLAALPATVTLPAGNLRWLDIADQPYAAAFRGSYGYHLATVTVTYDDRAPVLRGRLRARGLKPNFAYQIKLTADSANLAAARLGRVGRFWQEEWGGTAWINGWNLNDKGDGSAPSPNDHMYAERLAAPEPTSPTGRKYRFSSYLIMGYLVTDERGRAECEFAADRSYHVLWKADQRERTEADGEPVTAAFDADPTSDRAYDTDYEPRTVSVYGEWERLPLGGTPLPAGEYAVMCYLTEESFHGSGGALAGGWAAALGAEIRFVIEGQP